MNNLRTSIDQIEYVVKHNKFAILATESGGQPHVSLVAISPFGNFRQLIFATRMNTLKYRNFSNNSKIALLIENRDDNIKNLQGKTVLTIIGQTEEITNADYISAYETHLKRNPQMKSFMQSSDCVLIRVIAKSYQLVNGIDDIRWIEAEDLDSI